MKKPRSWPVRIASTIALAVWIVLAAVFLGACVTTPQCDRRPPTPTELAAMDEPTWQAYLRRVEAWSAAAGEGAVSLGMSEDDVLKFALALTAVEDATRLDIASVARSAGSPPALVTLLALEAQALLDARGGLPSGGRGKEFLQRAATAFVAGAAQAQMARGARS